MVVRLIVLYLSYVILILSSTWHASWSAHASKLRWWASMEAWFPQEYAAMGFLSGGVGAIEFNVESIIIICSEASRAPVTLFATRFSLAVCVECAPTTLFAISFSACRMCRSRDHTPCTELCREHTGLSNSGLSRQYLGGHLQLIPDLEDLLSSSIDSRTSNNLRG